MDEKIKKSLNHIAATPEGQDFLNWLMISCGWEKTIVASDDPQATQYWAARRGVYGGIRQNIEPRHLKVIEFLERKAATNDGSSTTTKRKRSTTKRGNT